MSWDIRLENLDHPGSLETLGIFDSFESLYTFRKLDEYSIFYNRSDCIVLSSIIDIKY